MPKIVPFPDLHHDKETGPEDGLKARPTSPLINPNVGYQGGFEPTEEKSGEQESNDGYQARPSTPEVFRPNLDLFGNKLQGISFQSKIELRDNLWERFHGMELEWDKIYGTTFIMKLINEGYKETQAAIDKSKGKQVETIKTGELYETGAYDFGKKILHEIGISIPVGRTIEASLSFAIETAAIVIYYYDLKNVNTFKSSSEKGTASDVMQIATEGLAIEIKRQMKVSTIKTVTYAYDVASSVIDFTGLSKLLSGGARLGQELYLAYSAKRKVDKVNKVLSSKEPFDLKIFTEVPLMSCYLLDILSDEALLGLFTEFDSPQDFVSKLSSADQLHIKNYKEDLVGVRKIAMEHIMSTPYAFEHEIQRRGPGVRSGAKQRAIDWIPAPVKPAKYDRTNQPVSSKNAANDHI